MFPLDSQVTSVRPACVRLVINEAHPGAGLVFDQYMTGKGVLFRELGQLLEREVLETQATGPQWPIYRNANIHEEVRGLCPEYLCRSV